MKKVYKCLPAVIFCVFIAVMLILFLALPKKDYSSSEKRYLAKAPAFSLSALFDGSFEKNFESYLTDHTAGRDFWVGMNAYFRLATGNHINGHSTKENGYTKGVYCGKDGYLINEPERMTNLSRNAGFIEEFAQHLAAGNTKNVDVTVLVAPSTGYICADKLPDLHYDYHDEEVFAELSETFQTASFVDIRDELSAAYKDGNQVFYRTDHHWTTFGAYTAYKALGEALGYNPNPESAYEKTAYPGFYGTTYSTSGFRLTDPDEIEVWDNPSNDIDVTIIDGDTVEQKDMYFYSHLDEDDKYPVFLDGNHPYTVIKNPNASSQEKLLVVKDSFAHSLVPFLADHYAEIIMVDMRYYSMPMQPIIEHEGVDRVLFLYSIDNLATDNDIGYIE